MTPQTINTCRKLTVSAFQGYRGRGVAENRIGYPAQPGYTCAAHGLEEHVRITLIFLRIISFMLFTVLCYSRICTFSEEFLIHNSCR